jgi:hypothetical protein
MTAFLMRESGARRLGFAEPDEVRVEQEEEDEHDGEEIHVETEHDTAVVEVPALLDAAEGVGHAGEAAEDGDDEPEGGVEVGEAGEEGGEDDAGEDEEIASDEGSAARVEDSRGHVRERANDGLILFLGRGCESNGCGLGWGELADVGDGELEDAEIVGGVVVEADAEEGFELVGDADVELGVHGAAQEGGEVGWRGVEGEGAAGGDEETAVGVVDVGEEVDFGGVVAVGEGGEGELSGEGEEVDGVAAEGAFGWKVGVELVAGG